MATPSPLTPRSLNPFVSPDWTPRQIIAGTSVILAVGLALWLVYVFRLVVFSLFVAIVVSTALSPLVDWLQRRGLSRTAAVVTTYAALLALAVGFGLLIGPPLAAQGAAVAARVDDYYQSLLTWLYTSPSRLVLRLVSQLPGQITPTPAPTQTGDQTLATLGQVLAYAGVVGDGLFVLGAVLLLAFYWTVERERVLRSLLLLIPLDRREPAREFIAATEAKVGAYLRGVAVLCLIVGSLATIAFAVIGLPSALLLGMAAGLFEAVPLVGPALGALPAVIIALSIDPSKAVWVLAAVGLIQLLENALLVPRIMGRAVGVQPLVTLLAVAAFSSLFGLAGAILAIPLAAVVQMLLDRFVFGPSAADQHAPQGRDRLSVLRYEVQDLVRDVRKQTRDKSGQVDDQADHVEDTLESIATDLDSILASWGKEPSQ